MVDVRVDGALSAHPQVVVSLRGIVDGGLGRCSHHLPAHVFNDAPLKLGLL
jgi:hypothetical protein